MPARTATRSKPKKKVSVRSKHKKRKVVAKIKIVGRVTHYYDRIGVAIVELARPLHVGDVVKMKHGEHELVQPVQSLQIEHQPVASAKKGAVVGMKVSQEVKEGALVMPS